MNRPNLPRPNLKRFARACWVWLVWSAGASGVQAQGVPPLAFPLARGSRDAAERFVAGSGSYTVHATGPGAGIVLIELYAVP